MNQDANKNNISEILKLAKQLQLTQSNFKNQSLFQKRVKGLVQQPKSKFFLIKLLDTAFRSKNYSKTSAYIKNLLNTTENYQGLLSPVEKILVKIYQWIGVFIPAISIPILLNQIKKGTSSVLFILDNNQFKTQTRVFKQKNTRVNTNLIGEDLLGEAQAEKRIESYCNLLENPEVTYISIKISTIYSQISVLAFEETIEVLITKLSILYDKVLEIEKKTGITKFVNLDMEAYNEVYITFEVFLKTLSLSKYKNLQAGIVLQAYLPDSYELALKLQKWALKRTEQGGAPVKVRLVKGANLEMEKITESIEDWPLATYNNKLAVDAQYKKILLLLLTENAKSLHIGVASHNIFDLSFAIYHVQKHKIVKHVDFEVLAGLAEATVSALQQFNNKLNILFYTPVVSEKNYQNAIAYLVRRLDESTQPGNFLKEGLHLEVGSEQWKLLEKSFLKSIQLIDKVSSASHRNQDRNQFNAIIQSAFKNVHNTDFTISKNREWAKKIIKKWQNPIEALGNIIPVVGPKALETRKNISLINFQGTLPWRYELSSTSDYQQAIDETSEWYTFSTSKKAAILKQAALNIEKNRGNLIGVAITELGKIILEVDNEISEAVDFANYYAENLLHIDHEFELESTSKGIHLILSPWNFPIAIPIGGVLASLAAGKRVILKPSTNAAACAYLTCKCLWDAGVPKNALYFLPAYESVVEPFLATGNLFDAVILTGGTSTAKHLLKQNPKLHLFAETGGKNATIVTAMADREQAIKHVVQSAFGHSGQKCSATSLLILEEEVYNDVEFKKTLKDAAASKIIGSPWNFDTAIGPLSVPISGKIKASLQDTDDAQWLLKPTLKDDFFMYPGIKWGVEAHDFEYKTELFGPILSVMKASTLKHAIALVNASEYGLTSGLESLDKNEIEYWKKHIQAGNLYINRTTTGAIVQRQPFGGIKASSFGFGMKAGGPNYLLQFLKIKNDKNSHLNKLKENYTKSYLQYFKNPIDPVNLRGQTNTNRYLLPKQVFVLVGLKTSNKHIEMVYAACKAIDVKCIFFGIKKRALPIAETLNLVSTWTEILENQSFETTIRALNYNSLSNDFLSACHEKAIHIYKNTPHSEGRIELLNYLTEQNISDDYHRYGNLMEV